MRRFDLVIQINHKSMEQMDDFQCDENINYCHKHRMKQFHSVCYNKRLVCNGKMVPNEDVRI